MKLSVVIPVFNEEQMVFDIFDKMDFINDKLSEIITCEFIFVDDGSHDTSRDLITKLILDKGCRKFNIIFHNENIGKGSAIRTGVEFATGDIIAIHDCDLEYETECFIKLIRHLLKYKLRAVYGSRFLGKSITKNMSLSSRFGNYLVCLFFNILNRSNVSDVETAFKVFDRKIIKNYNLISSTFEIEIELTSIIVKELKYIVELPINYNARSYEDGKKIKWYDGIKALVSIIKFKLLHYN